MQLKAGRLAFKVALIYVIVAGCWILFSDELVKIFISNPDERIYLSIIKGWGFVIVTGGLLYQVLRRLLQRWEREAEQRQKAEVGHQEAGEALRESEERFVNLFQKAPLGYQSLDADGRFIEVNEAWVATLGYPRAEVIGKWFGDFLAPEFVEAFRQRFPMFKAAGKIHSEFEMLHRNGERRFIAFEGRIGHKKDGSFRQTHCILQDITERKRAEETIARERQLLRTLIDLLPEIFYIKDLDSRFLIVNETLAKLVGKDTPAQVLGLSDANLFPAGLAAELRAEELKVFAGEPLINHENIMVFPDGRMHTVLTTKLPFRDSQGRICGLVGIGHDITERKVVEDELRRVNTFLDSIIKHIPNMVFLKDAKTLQFVRFNRAGENLLGRSEAELLGKTDYDFFPKDLADYFTENDRQVLRGQEVVDIPEERLQTRDKGERILHTRKVPVLNENGEPKYLLGISEDITERKQAEAVLQEREEQYRKVVESSPNCIFILQQNRFVLVNAAALKLFGASQPDELLGRDVFDFIHPDFHDLIRGRIVQAAHQEQALPLLEQKLLRLDGSVVDVEATSTRFQFQGQPALLVEAHDITTRKRAEAVLRESQALYHSLVTQLPIGIFRKDHQGRYILVNPWFCQLKGMKTEEFLGKTPQEVAAGEVAKQDAMGRATKYAAEGEDHHRLIMEAGKPIELEEEYATADGRKQFVHVLKLPVFNPDGKVTGTQGILFDITARKRAEEEMNLQFSALSAAANAIVITDRAGKIEWVNPSFTKLTGYSADEAIGRTPRFLKSGQHPPEFYAGLWQTILAGHVWHGELVNKRKDGQLYNVEMTITPVRGADGQIVHFVDIKQDVTERKQAEGEIQRQAAFAHFNPNPVLELSTTGEVRYFNDAALQMARTFGQEHPAQILPPNTAAIVRDCLATTKPLLRLETHAKNRTISWSFFPVTLNHVVHCYAGDITKRKQLEEQFRQSQKMEAIGQLASGVAHDFNNILAVIQLQAGLLKAEQNISAKQLDFASEIEKSTQRAADLTRQLLLFSRKQALQPRDLDLNEVVTSITKMLQRTLGEDVQMQFEFSPQPLLIHADAGMVDQILMNLSVNARDAMPKGGQLIIETSAVEFDEITAAQTSQARPGSFACVSVSDTGGGIPPEVLPKIFEPFFTTKAVGKGTGLGLATVFGIVQQHQGWINVYSKAGQGTTFRIYLPRLTKASDKKADWSSLASIRSGNETILLVEDDSSLRASIRIALSRLGYRVLEAPTGVAALEVWKQHRDEIRLLFTDMVMPEGMNGKELARRLLQENPKLKVIYASGYSADLADKDLLLQEGVNFLTKPFAAHKLAQTIRNCLDKI
jgi:PAS domain S-box-containing protein